MPRAAKPVLGAEASVELRDRLLVELNGLGSPDAAALWAHRSLGEKNRLTAPDALRVEEAFQAKLATLRPMPTDATGGPANAAGCHVGLDKHQLDLRRRTKAVDKSALALPEPRRIRDREHVRSVAKHPCLICGRLPSDAHHLRFAQSRALGRKVSDEFIVPLCRGHHREVHRCGDEQGWWREAGIDPIVAARDLWLETHPVQQSPGHGPAATVDQPHEGRKRGRRLNSVRKFGTKPTATSGPQ